MTSPDERREVAAGLRTLAHDNQGVLGPMRMRHVMDEGTRILGTVGLPDCAHVLTRYADLIDPTCEVEGSEPLYMDDETEFRLSCGHVADMVTDCPPAFCPECGARVVTLDGHE